LLVKNDGFDWDEYDQKSDWCEYKELNVIECHHWQESSSKNYRIFNKICECISEDKESIILNLNTSSNCEFSFRDKMVLAEIDNNWYCVCEEEYAVYWCEERWNEDSGVIVDECGDVEFEHITERANRTTEFKWSY